MKITEIVSEQSKEKMFLMDIEDKEDENKNLPSISLTLKKVKTKKIDKNNVEKEIIDFIRNNAEIKNDVDDLSIERIRLAIKNKRAPGNFLITSYETLFSDYENLKGFKDFEGKIYKTQFLPKNEMIVGYINENRPSDVNVDAGIILNEDKGVIGFLPNSVQKYFTLVRL